MRTLSKIKYVVVLICLISQFAHSEMIGLSGMASAENVKSDYAQLKNKVWLWTDSMQVQFIEPETGSTVILDFKYDEDKSKSLAFTITSNAPKNSGLHPVISKLISSTDEITLALKSINLLNNEIIVVNGAEGSFAENWKGFGAKDKYVGGVFIVPTLEELKILDLMTNPKEKKMARLTKLIERVIPFLSSDYINFDEKAASETMVQNTINKCTSFLL